MNKKVNYKTRWRNEILTYFQETPGNHVTANDVYEYFKSRGRNIGMTTVYRQLDNLVNEELLNRYTVDAGSPCCYEYADPSANCRENQCFHCKCEVCGRLIHLHCGELSGIQEHLSEHHSFALDPMRTVFYGVCDLCR